MSSKWNPKWSEKEPEVTITFPMIYAYLDSATCPTDESRATARSIKEYLQKLEVELKECKARADYGKAGAGFFPNSWNGIAEILGQLLGENKKEKQKDATS